MWDDRGGLARKFSRASHRVDRIRQRNHTLSMTERGFGSQALTRLWSKTNFRHRSIVYFPKMPARKNGSFSI